MEHVVLVDPKDQYVGTMEKLEAHKQGQLHRAFSVLVYNSQGEMLLQKRASHKYHSGGLWTNACCSHPRPEESCIHAAERRLVEEIGLSANPEFLYKFIYKADLDNELTEHEYDHVLVCQTDKSPILNPNEVEDFKYVSVTDMLSDIERYPQNYTYWFRLIADNLKKRLEINYSA